MTVFIIKKLPYELTSNAGSDIENDYDVRTNFCRCF